MAFTLWAAVGRADGTVLRVRQSARGSMAGNVVGKGRLGSECPGSSESGRSRFCTSIPLEPTWLLCSRPPPLTPAGFTIPQEGTLPEGECPPLVTESGQRFTQRPLRRQRGQACASRQPPAPSTGGPHSGGDSSLGLRSRGCRDLMGGGALTLPPPLPPGPLLLSPWQGGAMKPPVATSTQQCPRGTAYRAPGLPRALRWAWRKGRASLSWAPGEPARACSVAPSGRGCSCVLSLAAPQPSGGSPLSPPPSQLILL